MCYLQSSIDLVFKVWQCSTILLLCFGNIPAEHPSVTLRPDMAPRSGLQTKNKPPIPSCLSTVPPKPTPHYFVLIRPAPKQRGCSSVRPLLQRALVRLPCHFLSPVTGRAACPRSVRRSPTW